MEAPRPLWERNVAWRGEPLAEVIPTALENLWSGPQRSIAGPQEVEAVGHRVVHGGRYRETTRLTREVRAVIAEQEEFAPAHNRFELEAIDALDGLLGANVPQFAVFDTAFHTTLEPAAYVYPGPYDWLENGIRRYGFHGISYQYAARRAAEMLGKNDRLVICHLGNGASITAVRGGKSVDTTMGFTPLEGLMMGTRSGSLDPGILFYLLRRGYTPDQLEGILNRESGLKGISGLSGDMREILRAAEGDQRAQLAFEIYSHRVTREAGAMVSVLGGMDALVFTGGVGENAAPLRERVCRQFAFLGLELDAAKNTGSRGDADIATPQSRVRVLVIHAQEEWEIARECFRASTEQAD